MDINNSCKQSYPQSGFLQAREVERISKSYDPSYLEKLRLDFIQDYCNFLQGNSNDLISIINGFSSNIPNFYIITSTGRVFDINRKELQRVNSEGDIVVDLICFSDIPGYFEIGEFFVDVIVSSMFAKNRIPKSENKYIIEHIDGDKTNNNIENLKILEY